MRREMGFRPTMVAPCVLPAMPKKPHSELSQGQRLTQAVTGVPDPSVSKVSRWPHLPRKSFLPHLVPPARSDAKETEEITN